MSHGGSLPPWILKRRSSSSRNQAISALMKAAFAERPCSVMVLLPGHVQRPRHPRMIDHRDAPGDAVDQHVDGLALHPERPCLAAQRELALALQEGLAQCRDRAVLDDLPA